MNEFLSVLKIKLMDRLPPAELEEQLALYEDYIKEQLAGGKTSEQVLRKLGDPAKVADLILEHCDGAGLQGEQPCGGEQQTGCAGCDFCGEKEMTAEEINKQIQNPEHGIHAEFKENEGWDVRLGGLKLNTWYGTLIILGIVLVIFVLISELLR
ncbi:MAG: hypothetical protein LUF32_04895 [Clostridiales bacterium]|nr:hypothetical protein [Clostridiales bacterium]